MHYCLFVAIGIGKVLMIPSGEDELVLHLSYRNGGRGDVRVDAATWISSKKSLGRAARKLDGDCKLRPLLREIKAYQRMDEVGYFCQEGMNSLAPLQVA
eukprot:Skav220251  [mRNA]  locus=scaffold1696:41522:44240:+ [translate_table: standard]